MAHITLTILRSQHGGTIGKANTKPIANCLIEQVVNKVAFEQGRETLWSFWMTHFRPLFPCLCLNHQPLNLDRPASLTGRSFFFFLAHSTEMKSGLAHKCSQYTSMHSDGCIDFHMRGNNCFLQSGVRKPRGLSTGVLKNEVSTGYPIIFVQDTEANVAC